MPKYVILGLDFDPAYELFRDVFDSDDVEFVRTPINVSSFIGAKLVKKLLRFHLIPQALLPFLFSKVLLRPQNEELVFIYTNPWIDLVMRSGFLDMLKSEFPGSYHVASLLDVHAARNLDIENTKRNYDLVTIYDEAEAKAMGISYLPAMCSKSHLDNGQSDEEYDLSFVGQAKERYPELIEVYKRLSEEGLKCHFYIVGVPETKQYPGDGLAYGDTFLDAEEYFSFISSSRCLLELQLHETAALTARVREAVMYDKKLLTNNASITDFAYYKPEMIQIYENAESIDLSFFRKDSVSYGYRGEYSPRSYLESVYSLCKAKH